MDVISDKVKFLDALHIKESLLQHAGHKIRSLVIGILVALAIVAVSFSLVHSSFLFFFHRFSFSFSFSRFFILSFVALGIYIYRSYMNSKSHRDTSINTALGVLGETVAQIVFIPVISTALHYKDASLKEKNKKFIWQEMKEWGYSSEYIDDFLAREWKKPLGNLMDQIDALDKILKGKFRRKRGRAGRVFANDVNKKDLCHKSMDLCQNLYTRNGIVDSEIKCYLDQLKYKMKV